MICCLLQVDFSYPPLVEGEAADSQECPPEWKHLPFLALPDGAHNFEDGEDFLSEGGNVLWPSGSDSS